MAVSALVALGASAATAATIVSVMTTIGTVMTVVGAVTGNKDLMKIGGIIGIVGAVGTLGSMASGAATATASVTPLAEAASSVASEVVNPAVQSISSTALDVGASSASGLEAVSSAIPIKPELIPTALPPMDSVSQAVSATPVPASSYNLDPTGYAPTEIPATSTAAPASAQGTAIPQTAIDTTAANGVQVQAPQAPMVNGDGVRINNPSAYTPAGVQAPNSANQFFDKITGMWNGLGERGKSQLIGAGASMFSGAQNAAQKEKELAMQQQRLNQTSYGSAVPRLSIINQR